MVLKLCNLWVLVTCQSYLSDLIWPCSEKTLYFWHFLGWWRGCWVLVGKDLFLVHNDSMYYNSHWLVGGGNFTRAKKVTFVGNVGKAVDAVNFSAKRSNPCSGHSKYWWWGLCLWCKKVKCPHTWQWMQYAADAVCSGCGMQ